MAAMTIEQVCQRALDVQRALDAIHEGELDYLSSYEHYTKFDLAAGYLLMFLCPKVDGWYDPSWWQANPAEFTELATTLARLGVIVTVRTV